MESLLGYPLPCFDFIRLTKYCSGLWCNGNGWDETVFWRRKPAYVEWDVVRSDTRGFGADIYLSAAPMVIVHQIDPEHCTYDGVWSAVEEWVASVPDKYRLNEEFEEFKAIAHRLGDGDASPEG